ncbi:MAG: 4-hydroxythreonine-4-phosphate dehydrogenase PdxA [Bdellovibrionaceae bacterium]|nr:4-hydroxythreonine-4-phosphate dehydrogenase PdxA [Pseudobdellovibrionaceae bacterium]
MKSKLIVLTTGDTDGVGLEVTLKALAHIGPKRGITFAVWRDEKSASPLWKRVQQRFPHIVAAADIKDLLTLKNLPSTALIDIRSPLSPAAWVEQTAQACMKKQVHALVTGPISKGVVKKHNPNDLGHTEILARVSKNQNLTMYFHGSVFSVALLSAHLPLKKVPAALSQKRVLQTLANINFVRPLFPKKRLRVGVLGLNPHAGEQGLLGNEEKNVLLPAITKARQKYSHLFISNPLVPDATFLPQNQKQHDIYIACYHDQGLIPFKIVHGQNHGCQITLGLPFVRTSVDHGTAKDIFNKNRANPGSMIDAIEQAIALLKKS